MYDIMYDFYKDKSVFITGHTGFKGSWMCRVLAEMGAKVSGYSLNPPTNPSLFCEAGINKNVKSYIGDIRNYDSLMKAINETEPEIVIHMAAQPIVRDSYKNPKYTYETNVIGTVNILECIRNSESVKSFLNVTTDKVYLNREWNRGYIENDELDGYDPYSNSKSCSELVTNSYKRCFFGKGPSVSTVRAGNVIGGGDFANDRIIPDCIRAAVNGDDIIIRNPLSVRPFQHVLDPIFAYLMISYRQYNDKLFEGNYNVGPDVEDCISAGKMADLFVKNWGNGIKWIHKDDNGPHESNFLYLDCSKIKNVFEWRPRWNVETVVQKTVEWYKIWNSHGNVSECLNKQIHEFVDR